MLGAEPETSLAMMTPIAPAAWALTAFCLYEQVPRSMKAIFPEMLFWIAEQASLVGTVPSLTMMTDPVVSNDCGPNAAVPVA